MDSTERQVLANPLLCCLHDVVCIWMKIPGKEVEMPDSLASFILWYPLPSGNVAEFFTIKVDLPDVYVPFLKISNVVKICNNLMQFEHNDQALLSFVHKAAWFEDDPQMILTELKVERVLETLLKELDFFLQCLFHVAQTQQDMVLDLSIIGFKGILPQLLTIMK